jgi:phenylalanyl-tRNA synthetase beta chain
MLIPLDALTDAVPGLLDAIAVVAPGAEPVAVVAERFTTAGLEVEGIRRLGRGADAVTGTVLGEILSFEELSDFKKPIRYCAVDVGADAPSHIVCGATNFAVGDRVVVALPGAVLPGPFPIAARTTYGRVSEGMICSARELGLGDDHGGILTLDRSLPVGVDAAEALGLVAEVLDIAVLPDRGYALSTRGLAREAAALFDLPFTDPAAVPLPEPDAGDAWPVEVHDRDACPRYVARLVTDVDATARTPWPLVRTLVLGGMRSISVAVDVTNGVLLGLGQPLHAFDADRLSGPIVVRRAAVGERLVTLDGVDRALSPEDLVICDDTGPIALAGVMGGRSTEVSAGTRRIVLEAACFAPTVIARTARRHRLASEASRRFERGVDPALAPYAAQVAVDALVRYARGSAAAGVTDVDHRPAPVSLAFDPLLAGRLAGRPYEAAAVARRLRQVGCALATDEPSWSVGVPSWRPDLTGSYELVEEVVRLEGIDGVPSTLPHAPAGRGLTPQQRRRRAVARTLADAGLVEVLTSPFLGPSEVARTGIPAEACVRLANPLSETEALLRPSLLPGLVAAAVRNISRGRTGVAVFELGQVYRRRPGDGSAGAVPPAITPGRRASADELAAVEATLPDEPRLLAALFAGQRVTPSWTGPGRVADWADAVEAAELVARSLGLRLVRAAAQHAPWHPGRCAALSVVVGDATVPVGFAGELHPRLVGQAGLPPRACAVELDLDALLAGAAAADRPAAPRVSAYPVATRDVALVVPLQVPAAAVEEALWSGAGPLVEEVSLFDVYQGDPVPAGARSLAYALRFRALDRTLTDEEVNAARDAAVGAAAGVGATLRA